MKTKSEILSLFHHIHHFKNEHEVHHCGGEHSAIDKKVNYEISHCKCGQHSINKEIAIGHATGPDAQPTEIKIKFLEKCPFGGWHIESGVAL